MNTKDFLRPGAPLGQATRRATNFISKFVLVVGDKSRLHEEVAAIVCSVQRGGLCNGGLNEDRRRLAR